jgi:large subunit ribosomal protein L21e
VNLRVEHVRHSKCRQEFLDRVKSNHDAHAIAKEKGGELLASHLFFLNSDTYGHLERINLRRIPALPREARTVSTAQNAPQTIVPVPYETTI